MAQSVLPVFVRALGARGVRERRGPRPLVVCRFRLQLPLFVEIRNPSLLSSLIGGVCGLAGAGHRRKRKGMGFLATCSAPFWNQGLILRRRGVQQSVSIGALAFVSYPHKIILHFRPKA